MADLWTQHVLPHGPLVAVGSRLWLVEGTLSRNPLPRTMVVHRLERGGLLIHSAIALDEPTLTRLLEHGRPEVLIVPNGLHRLDAAAWKARFPGLKVIAPVAAQAAASKKVVIDGSCEEVLPAYGVRWHAPHGLKPGELCYELECGDGVALVFTDILMNLPDMPGFSGRLLRQLGSTGFFGMTRIGRFFWLKDRDLFRKWLEALAATPRLKAICVAHGAAIVDRAADRLREAAARL